MRPWIVRAVSSETLAGVVSARSTANLAEANFMSVVDIVSKRGPFSIHHTEAVPSLPVT